MIAIDLGSNTIRVLQIDCDTKEVLYEYQKIVRTAENLVHTGIICDDAKNRIIDAILEAKNDIDFDTDIVRAVTTQAMRVASNSKEILSTIYARTNVKFEIIEGDLEALLTIKAVQNRLLSLDIMPNNGFVMIDIGGASTEVAFVNDINSIARSFPIGIVTLAESFESIEKLSKLLPEKLKAVADFANKIKSDCEILVATAGTPTTVAAMKIGLNFDNYDTKKINGTTLKRAEIIEQLEILLEMSEDMRLKSVGTSSGDLIATGIVLFLELMKILDFKECIVVDDGLREGVAIAGCEELLR